MDKYTQLRKAWQEYQDKKDLPGFTPLYGLNMTSWMGEYTGQLLDDIDKLEAHIANIRRWAAAWKRSSKLKYGVVQKMTFWLDRVEIAEARAAELERVLMMYPEWMYSKGSHTVQFCVCCGNLKEDGHTTNCPQKIRSKKS